MVQTNVAAQAAANVRAELARAGYSGRKLSQALGWSHSATARRLSGATALTVEDLLRLADFLDIPVARLMPEVAA